MLRAYIGIIIITVCGINGVVAIISPAALELILHIFLQPAVNPKYNNFYYTPNDYLVLSLLTVIVCGLLSPLTLILSIPALLLSKEVLHACMQLHELAINLSFM